jgi:hypothetical protein
MALVSKSIPNLINGVSQQSPTLRLESQGEEQENGLSDVVDGLKKRPPTEWLNSLQKVVSYPSTAPGLYVAHYDPPVLEPIVADEYTWHTYKRSDDELYTVAVELEASSPIILVYDKEGRLRYQSNVGSFEGNGFGYAINLNTHSTSGYLGNPSKLKFTTVADATFIVNTDKTVALPSTSQGVLSHDTRKSLVYLKSVNYGRNYNVTLLNSSGSSFAGLTSTTPKQITTVATNDDQTINSDVLKTSTVINALRNIVNDTDVTNVYPSGTPKLPYFVLRSGLSPYTIRVSDDDGGVNLKAFRTTAKSFTDLPNQCEDGFVLGVVGDNQKKEDDFYVKFEGEGGSGFWRECVAPNVNNGIDASTMPHQLVQNADESFSFQPISWDNRKCGDNDTNPFPSFIGNKITDIFFHRNRLGILSGENVIFSEASSYYNFFRTTVRSLLDSDPIDVAVSQNEVSDLKAALPIQDNLLLFSALNQFTLSSDQLLTPSEVTIEQSTRYESDLTSDPVGSGTSVFFGTRNGDYGGVREFITKDDVEVKDALNITSHVPKYLKGRIRQMVTSPNEDMLVALTDDGTAASKKECYVYKWYDNGQERLQSSWSKWKFDEEITHLFFTNNLIYVVFKNGYFEKLDLTYDTSKPHLDHLIELEKTGDYFYGIGKMSKSPLRNYDFTAGANLQGVSMDGEGLGRFAAEANLPRNYNMIPDSIVSDSLLLHLKDNEIYVGTPYTFKYKLSEQVFKPVQGDTTHLARFQLRKIAFNFSDTGSFEVAVESLGKPVKTAEFTGNILDTTSVLDQANIIDNGSFEVGVQAQASQTDITITNDTHLPSTFQSAEWEGYIVLRNQRL